MAIEVVNVRKSFQKKDVLRDISLQAMPGEILGLIGPSGAGKTTLERVIIGAINADKGDVFIDGKLVPSMDLLYQIGYMPQSDALYPDLTGYDNLVFFGNLYHMKGKALHERIMELLDFIGLTEDKDKLVTKYSGGMKKRLSFIISLLHNPKYLVLDEPTVGIDPLLRKKIWALFRDLANEQKTLIISTHVMDEAITCDKVALIYEGKLLDHGTVKELKSKTPTNKLEDLFIIGGDRK